MVTSQLRRQIRIMLKYEDPPKFLVIHVGANDSGNVKTKDLGENLIQAMTFISKDLPDTKIVWSQMLPRLKWRNSNDSKAMEKCRYRVNNAVANYILESGGYYIRYPDISRTENMYKSDGLQFTTDTIAPDQLADPQDDVIPMKRTRRSEKRNLHVRFSSVHTYYFRYLNQNLHPGDDTFSLHNVRFSYHWEQWY
ncbi:unnamed protein product [Mytilus coruscus]|uniref:SGNH hydrolase-type esterase domain-containing protein n=1 Tax=Mytilus coruscus TaxID=42192 RepID=A0A6J8A745_MYTCO|nr:unnamed protein product [Mytilus coruscus]